MSKQTAPKGATRRYEDSQSRWRLTIAIGNKQLQINK
jgi:hypothetical protein